MTNREYPYSISQTKFGIIHTEQLHNELLEAGIPLFDGLTNDGEHLRVRCREALSEESLAQVTAVVSEHDGGVLIGTLKRVDLAVQTKIFQGFVFGGKTFSLSLAAQAKISGMYQLRDSITYPVRVNTINDQDTYDIHDTTTLTEFYLGSLRAIQVCLDLGVQLKDQVRAAKTLEDFRSIPIEDEG